MSAPAALQQAPTLPFCIPTTYTDQAGQYCLAYPRSPWNQARYLVVRCGSTADPRTTDVECVHDDFGALVPMRERRLGDDWASAMAWRPVQPEALS